MRLLCVFFLCLTVVVQAADVDKYQFYFFYKDHGGRTSVMEKVFDRTVEKLGEQVVATKVDVTDPGQQGLLEQFRLKRSSVPYTLVVAPNGAVTGRFALSVTEQQLVSALGCPGKESCLKAMQNGKYVILCMHRGDTNAMRGVKKFGSDRRFARITQVVALDEGDIREHEYLQKFGIDTYSHKPLTVLMSPSGKVLGVYEGNTSKDQLIEDIEDSK